jgi:hypothetical protein
MKSILRRIAAAALAAFGFSLPASANSFGPDFTDLWYNPNEAGWGINLIHQYNTIFATMFVYEGDRSPHWFVADNMSGSGMSYSGSLLQTSGPAYNAAWTGGVTAPGVGSISVTFSTLNTGTLTYTVNGQTFTKAIQRQTFRGNNIGGQYYGGFSGTISGCTNGGNGLGLAVGLMDVSHANFQSGGSAAITLRFLSGQSEITCTYNGGYSAQGRIGTLSGNFSCTSGTTGTFTLGEVDVTRNGMTSTYFARDQNNCTYSGYFGGTRDVR